MRYKSWFSAMLAAALLTQAAASHAQEADGTEEQATAGAVQLDNRSEQWVKVHLLRYVGSDGVPRGLNGSVTLRAHQQMPLVIGGVLLRAQRLDYLVETSAGQTSWTTTDDSDADDVTPVVIDDAMVPFAGILHGVAGGEAGVVGRDFATSAQPQTLVFHARSWSGAPVRMQVLDASDAVVAESSQRAGDSARCMLSTAAQGRYKLRVAGGDDPGRFSLRVTVVSHGYVLGEAITQEGLKAATGLVWLKLFGDRQHQQAFWDQLKSGAQKDAIALLVIEAFIFKQRAFPALDPLTLSDSAVADAARGDDEDERLVSVRRAFVDQLLARIHVAAGGS